MVFICIPYNYYYIMPSLFSVKNFVKATFSRKIHWSVDFTTKFFSERVKFCNFLTVLLWLQRKETNSSAFLPFLLNLSNWAFLDYLRNNNWFDRFHMKCSKCCTFLNMCMMIARMPRLLEFEFACKFDISLSVCDFHFCLFLLFSVLRNVNKLSNCSIGCN